MQRIPGISRRQFCGTAATTVAVGSLAFPGLVLSERSIAMNAVTQPSRADSIREFHVSFPDADLIDLRRRINATKWPEKETVPDATQGVQLATVV
jgi:hypothetical protein